MQDEYGTKLDGTQVLASVVQYMISAERNDIALALIPCSLQITRSRDFSSEGNIDAILRGPQASYDFFQAIYSSQGEEVDDSRERFVIQIIEALLPLDTHLRLFAVGLEMTNPDPEWRFEAARVAGGEIIVNQAPEIRGGQILWWNNLRFRSEPERRIASALDAHRLLFFPNCVARLSEGDRQVNREPDFLVCEDSRWGILEIDGNAYHPSAARDHARDRLFRAYGIRVVERFTATECLSDAPSVVARFLGVLRRNG